MLRQVADPSLPIGMTEIGTMTSIFPIAYGFRCGSCGASWGHATGVGCGVFRQPALCQCSLRTWHSGPALHCATDGETAS